MKHDFMKDALAKRRGQGLEITISVEPKNEDKHSDLAPKGDQPPEPGNPNSAQATMPGMEAPQPDAVDPELHSALIGPMSDADKEDLKGRKPRSLMERAKMAHMGK